MCVCVWERERERARERESRRNLCFRHVLMLFIMIMMTLFLVQENQLSKSWHFSWVRTLAFVLICLNSYKNLTSKTNFSSFPLNLQNGRKMNGKLSISTLTKKKEYVPSKKNPRQRKEKSLLSIFLHQFFCRQRKKRKNLRRIQHGKQMKMNGFISRLFLENCKLLRFQKSQPLYQIKLLITAI